MIARDFHFREDDWAKLNVSMVQDVEWVQHHNVTLTGPSPSSAHCLTRG